MKKLIVGARLLSSLVQSQTYTCTPNLVSTSGQTYWDAVTINSQTLNHPPQASEPPTPYYNQITTNPIQNISGGNNTLTFGGHGYSNNTYPTRNYSLYIDSDKNGTFLSGENIIQNSSCSANWALGQIQINTTFNITQTLLDNSVYNMRLVIAWPGDQFLTTACNSSQTNAVVIDFSVRYHISLSNQQYRKTELVVYPNPSKDVVNFGTDVDLSYELYDVDSRLIYTGSGKSVDVVGLNSGMYILKTSNQDAEISINRIIKN